MISCLDVCDTIKFNFVLGSLILHNVSDLPVLWASPRTSYLVLITVTVRQVEHRDVLDDSLETPN
jgi:hypothetical protein